MAAGKWPSASSRHSAPPPRAFDHVVLHPIPDPKWPADPERDYTARIAREVLPRVRKEIETRRGR